MKFSNFFKHLNTVNSHRFLVMKYCFKLGLFHQGLVHDISKYHPDEFINGVKYYQGFRSPIDEERRVKGYSTAWVHHKSFNKHHYMYWNDNGNPIEMPKKYLKEMCVDRVCAAKIYLKDKYTNSYPLEYWLNGSDRSKMHQTSADTLEHYLKIVAENEFSDALKIIKKL